MNAKKHVPKGQKKKKCQKHWRRSIRGNLFFPLKLCSFWLCLRKKGFLYVTEHTENVQACPTFIELLNHIRPECLPYCIKYLLESGLFQIKDLMKAYRTLLPWKKRINENITKCLLAQPPLSPEKWKCIRMSLRSFE